MAGDLRLIVKALEFAARKHRDQRRKGAEGSPYINHPIALAYVLCNEGKITDPRVIAAAILHDTLEDTDTEVAELVREFGAEITHIVLEVSDDKRLSNAERKRLQIERAPHLSPKAKLVMLADKICNLRDMHTTPPVGWSVERQREYFDWARGVVAGMRGIHKALEDIFDAAYGGKP
jgi:GTP diphosphokinase / guanosine-3',5'-bis(diphosphate) 3'-diphosphatase